MLLWQRALVRRVKYPLERKDLSRLRKEATSPCKRRFPIHSKKPFISIHRYSMQLQHPIILFFHLEQIKDLQRLSESTDVSVWAGNLNGPLRQINAKDLTVES